MEIYFQTKENFNRNRLSGNLVNVGITSFYLRYSALDSIERRNYIMIDTDAMPSSHPLMGERSFESLTDFGDAESKVVDMIKSSNAKDRASAAYVVVNRKNLASSSLRVYDVDAEVYAFI